MNKKNKPEFINKQIVEMLLQSNQVSAQKVSIDLGWSPDTLNKYLRYELRISVDKRTALAKYFNIKYPSKLANYQPTKAIKATYERYSKQKAKQYELKKQKENKDAVIVDRNEWEVAKKLLINFANTNNTVIQKFDELDKKCDKLDRKISDLMNCIKEVDVKADTRQMYNVKLIKDLNQEISQLKLAARFNR